MWRCLIMLVLACGSSSEIVGVDAPHPGLIDGPIGAWRWYDIPGAICANGSPTGLAVNQGSGDRVVIYMSGGSACLDERCTIGTPSMREDGGFGAAQMQACVDGVCEATFPSASIFDRTPGASPFTDATYVFISNCAGDYYVGDTDHAFAGWTAQFHGARNQALFAAEITASFRDASRIVLTGGSAGSVGALLNYWQWVDAFPGRVDLVSDSFALVFADGPEWRYPLHAPRTPPACATCGTDYRSIYEFNASIAPAGARIAVLDSADNLTLDFATGYRYTQGLAALQPRLAALANTRYFVATGNVHILMQHPLASMLTDVDGVQDLAGFLAQMQADDPAWQSYSSVP